MTESANQILWRERVMAFDRSGLQRGVWCARHGFKLATLDDGRQQLAGDVDARAQADSDPSQCGNGAVSVG